MKRSILLISILFVPIINSASIVYAELADTIYPMFRYNPQHTAQTPYISLSNGTLNWKKYIGELCITSSPTIGQDGTIYIGASDYINLTNNIFVAISPTGEIKWTFKVDDWIDYSTAAISKDGTIYIGSYDTKLYAIKDEGSSYKLKWVFETNSWIHSSPVISKDGKIYFGTLDGTIYILEDRDTYAHVVKSLFIDGIIFSSPAINPSSGDVYIGSGDGKLYCIHADGTYNWSFQTEGIIFSSPAISDDGTVYIGSTDNNLYALSKDGFLKWSCPTQAAIYSSPAISKNGKIYIGSCDNYLYCIEDNGSSFSIVWKYHTDGEIYSSPVIDAKGRIYFGSWDDYLYCLNPDGSLRWKYLANGNISSSPTIDTSGCIYFGANDGYLYCIKSELDHIELIPSNITLYSGESYQFKAIGYDLLLEEVEGISFKWEIVPKTGDGIITQDGTFKATKKGTCIIKVSYKEKEAYAEVKIESKSFLSFSTHPDYQNKGVNVDEVYVGRLVMFRVVYTNSENIPLSYGYPKLHIYLDNHPLPGSPFFMRPLDYKDKDMRDGKEYGAYFIYRFSSQRYSYKFEAYNINNEPIDGIPTTIRPGPIVKGINYPPMLSFPNEAGFRFDGVEPNVITPGDTVTYKILYRDFNGQPPLANSPILYVYRDNHLYGTYTMEGTGDSYFKGKLYTKKIVLYKGGNYKYKFVAKDEIGLAARGYTTLRIGPNVSTQPVLSLGTVTKYYGYFFTYKIKYSDADNDPPQWGYPKLHILIGNGLFRSYPMYPVDGSNNYQNGKWYTCMVPLFYASKSYKFYFEAKDCDGLLCKKDSMRIYEGPEVAGRNFPPLLLFIGGQEYIYDCLSPNQGTLGTYFTFRVEYKDFNNDPPMEGYPQLVIYNKNKVEVGKYKLEIIENFSPFKGTIYGTTVLLSEIGNYYYKIIAKDDKGLLARGSPSYLRCGPIISSAPTLTWAGNTNFISDGLDPETGKPMTKFEYRVKFIDKDGDSPAGGYPKVYIYHKGVLLYGRGIPMRYLPGSGHYSNGIYFCNVYLPYPGTYSYRFEAKDRWGILATGKPLNLIDGPHLTFTMAYAENKNSIMNHSIKDAYPYPNPFKKEIHTYIKFANLSKPVRIRLFNIAGELVLEEGEFSSGDSLNIEGLASGVYIYLLNDDSGESKRGKLAIIK